jgi:MYXO-CTERM domain-containing protein
MSPRPARLRNEFSSLRTRCKELLTLASMLAAVFVTGIPHAYAAGVPVGFQDRQIYSGFTGPSALHVLPDGRVLVVQQNGVIRMIKDDTLLATPFYTVQNVDVFVETGCMGVTSDPGFMSNGYVYLYCTLRNGSESHNRVLRVTAQGDVASPASEQLILDLPPIPPDPMDGSRIYTHIGGAMRFGADGKLYVATGGHENSRVQPYESSASQRLDSPFGKLLRLNPDGSFPSDNPFYNTAGAYRGIHSLGLRNPFGMDIQPGTGRIFINDVGPGTYEEIIEAAPGANYGWPYFDGNSSNPEHTDGFYVYEHAPDSNGNFRCAVTGGTFYNPLTQQFPGAYAGNYLFADYCGNSIYLLDLDNPSSDTPFATDIFAPIGLATAPDGSLYYLSRNTTQSNPSDPGSGDGMGLLGKIEYTGSQAPNVAQHPQNQTVYIGDPATFSVQASGATSYQWQRDGANIPGANSASYTLASTSSADSGARFRVVLQNSFGSTISNPATLTITSDRLPEVTITSPAEGGGYRNGETLSYSGTATDAEDGALPASAYTWQANFHHDTHVHPFFAATSGSTGSTVTVPNFEATTANTWMRFMLSARDSAGQTQTVTRDIFPRHQLSALTPSGTPSNGSGPIERDSRNGEAITLGSVPYPKGLAAHAPSEISYQLGGVCAGRLISDVGIDASSGAQGSAVFQVFADGTKIYDSGLMRGGDNRKAINVDVSGAQQLRLVVTDGGDGNSGDRANWGGARLSCASLPPATLPDNAGGFDPGAPLVPPVGGGGCTTGGDGRFDPTLLGVALAALGLIVRRRRRR